MTAEVIDDVLARRFLLGQMSPEEQGRIQEMAFENHDTFVFLESVEDDLIDEYIQGDLSADEEEQFNSHFLTQPGRRKNLKISRLMQQHFNRVVVVDDRKFSFLSWFNLKPLWMRLSLVTATALALVIIAVLVFTRTWERMQPAPLHAGPDKPIVIPTPESSITPLVEPTASPAHVENKPKVSPTPEKQTRPAAYALLAPSSLPRGVAGGQQIKLPKTPNMTTELALITDRNFKTYEAALENKRGDVLHRWPNLKAEQLTSGKGLQIDVPVALLKPQESYRIVVSGVPSKGETETIASYPFEIVN